MALEGGGCTCTAGGGGAGTPDRREGREEAPTDGPIYILFYFYLGPHGIAGLWALRNGLFHRQLPPPPAAASALRRILNPTTLTLTAVVGGIDAGDDSEEKLPALVREMQRIHTIRSYAGADRLGAPC
ncbi:hypothetical protein GUJ93_ZPchr0007g3335 [Zizania palustris]|uniref:Uncharacterized protein n=1 Tax=Zizania palustris TaxID=103762 RepID=A0A8J5VSF2_ZIZPA|nr:hypothetical protein GUJ93_ZPchr0007g3335 [Zizania palustris]